MSTYTPDKWLLVKITGTDPHYRVFGSWYGDFVNGDSYRLNSGIKSVTQDGNNYIFHGATGSEYICHREMYGAHMYGMSVLDRLVKNSGDKMEIIYQCPQNILNMDWII